MESAGSNRQYRDCSGITVVQIVGHHQNWARFSGLMVDGWVQAEKIDAAAINIHPTPRNRRLRMHP